MMQVRDKRNDQLRSFLFPYVRKFLRTWESVIIRTEERKANIFSNIDSSGGVIQWEKS